MRLRVYEIANRSRKEIYLAATAMPKATLLGLFFRHPPRMLRHWRFESERIAYFEIERSLADGDLGGFIETYDHATPMPGWRIWHSWREGPRDT